MENYYQTTPPPFGGNFRQRPVSFFEAVERAFKKYCDFSGRASLSEFWWFYLFTFILSIIFNGTALGVPSLKWLSTGVGIVLLLPSLGLTWRRLHDIGRGGGWFFICFIPLIGIIWLIILLVKPSEPAPNRFGPIPNVE